MRERVMTDPKELVQIELKNAGFDIDSMQVPKRVYLLADGIYDAMIEKGCGEYKYPLGGALHVFKNNPHVGFIKGQMCSPGIATQAEDLVAGGVEEFIHVGLAGGINLELITRKEAIQFYKKKGFEERPCEWDGPGMFKMIR